jgi:hypothetical protein
MLLKKYFGENPPKISPGGPHVVGAITATSTSVVSSSVASNKAYIVVIVTYQSWEAWSLVNPDR